CSRYPFLSPLSPYTTLFRSLVQLQGGHAEVEQDRADGFDAEVGQQLWQLVIDGVDDVDALGEGGQSPGGDVDGLLVAVDADEVDIVEGAEHGFGMAAHAQGAVDDHGGQSGRSRGLDADADEFDHTLEEHRYVLCCHAWV